MEQFSCEWFFGGGGICPTVVQNRLDVIRIIRRYGAAMQENRKTGNPSNIGYGRY